MTSATVVRDPVCGMDIEIGSAAGKSEYKGKVYHFCGLACKTKFDSNEEACLRASGDKAKGGGCGSGCGCG